MSGQRDFVTAGELEAFFGKPVNHRWLSKYARKGFLPTGSTPGLGQGKGRETRYPKSVTRQVDALLRHVRTHGKNLRNVGWSMWSDGFDVDRKYWRTRLNARARSLQKVVRLIRSDDRKTQSLARRVARAPRPGRALGRAKRRLKKSDYSDFVDRLFSLVAGEYQPASTFHYRADEQNALTEQLNKALDIHSANPCDRVPRLPIDAPGVDREFLAISRALRQRDIVTWFQARTDREITKARDEIFPLIRGLAKFEALTTRFLNQSLGLKSLAMSSITPNDETMILFGWLLLRGKRGRSSKADELNSVIRTELEKLEAQYAEILRTR